MIQSQKPLSVYIHIPFCERKCVYCDFYSIETLSLQSEFLRSLEKEIDLKLQRYPELAGRTLETIFFGGGTPSLLSPKELESIVLQLKRYFFIAENCEFTLECNPGTVDLEKLTGYRELGVNRLSFGVQSFDSNELQFLGRIHDADQAREAINLARQAGFDNVSLDLIFSLPHQTSSILKHNLWEAIKLGTDHISAYHLIVERGTPLFRLVQQGKVREVDEDRSAELFELTQTTLEANGFHQYEISNYAKSHEKRAKHNMVYWDGTKDYVSFGPSAHEFIDGERSWNVSSLDQYRPMIEKGELPRISSEKLSEEQSKTEALYLQLRSIGVRLSEFGERFDEDLKMNETVKFYIEQGMLIIEDDTLRLTQTGYRFCDGLVRELMSEYETVC